jgi:hypothetical protein
MLKIDCLLLMEEDVKFEEYNTLENTYGVEIDTESAAPAGSVFAPQ